MAIRAAVKKLQWSGLILATLLVASATEGTSFLVNRFMGESSLGRPKAKGRITARKRAEYPLQSSNMLLGLRLGLQLTAQRLSIRAPHATCALQIQVKHLRGQLQLEHT